ncbi:MAG: hypothetical protein GXO79_00505 [Chlorobi bacterium]|nr:hypothetical protein [Chlorobiota bacterium]
MTKTNKESFEGALSEWFNKWESFLNKRIIDKNTEKSYYTHKRLRSAYRSLKTNYKWPFI